MRARTITIVIGVATAGLMALGAQTATGASPGGLYVALGTSVAAPPYYFGGGDELSYVDRLFPHYQSTLGVTELSNRAVGGTNSGSIRTGGQLDGALADINAASDTRAVTIDIGANAESECIDRWGLDSCPFRYNLFATLSALGAALDSDPGLESFTAMAYYNPASGLGDEGPRSESYYDRGLLGTNLVIDCETTAAPEVGLNDVIYQEAGRRGALVADPYPAFKAGGQSFMADAGHPNAAGQAAIADAFGEASPQCPEAGELPLPSPLPSNFSFGKVKTKKRTGTAKLPVEVVPAPGRATDGLDLAKTKQVKADEGEITAGGAFVSIKPRGNAKRRLNNEGRAKVKAIVTYTRGGGEPNTERKTIKLVKVAPPTPAAPALPTRCTVSSPCSYGTKLWITHDGPNGGVEWGHVDSHLGKCERRRRVVLFERRPGWNRELLSTRSDGRGAWRVWTRRIRELQPSGPQLGAEYYGKVMPKSRNRYLCRADRSRVLTWGD